MTEAIRLGLEMSLSEKSPAPKDIYAVDTNDGGIGHSEPINPHNFKQTKRHLLPRHIQLIAISGAIGTGLFVSESSTSGRRGAHWHRLGPVLHYTGLVQLVYFSDIVFMVVLFTSPSTRWGRWYRTYQSMGHMSSLLADSLTTALGLPLDGWSSTTTLSPSPLKPLLLLE